MLQRDFEKMMEMKRTSIDVCHVYTTMRMRVA